MDHAVTAIWRCSRPFVLRSQAAPRIRRRCYSDKKGPRPKPLRKPDSGSPIALNYKAIRAAAEASDQLARTAAAKERERRLQHHWQLAKQADEGSTAKRRNEHAIDAIWLEIEQHAIRSALQSNVRVARDMPIASIDESTLELDRAIIRDTWRYVGINFRRLTHTALARPGSVSVQDRMREVLRFLFILLVRDVVIVGFFLPAFYLGKLSLRAKIWHDGVVERQEREENEKQRKP